jgi:hypothetical protein
VNQAISLDFVAVLEWSALAAALLWTVALWCMLRGSRTARRAFRGKGYLRPPSGKAWIRFLYYKHYESFENPTIRFYYRTARICLFLFVFLAVAVIIFLGSVLLLERVTPANAPQIDDN